MVGEDVDMAESWLVLVHMGKPSQKEMLNPVAPTQQYVAVVPSTTMAPGQLLTVTPLTTWVPPACVM